MMLSFAGNDVLWITNTSSPRTFSWISTKISMSANRRIDARASGSCNDCATDSASERLLLQATIFMERQASPVRRVERRPGS